MLKTKIDELAEMAENKKVTLSEASEALDWKVSKVDAVSRLLDEEEVLELIYPINFFSEPYIIMKSPALPPPRQSEPQGEKLEDYDLVVDNVKGHVKIFSSKTGRPIYRIELPHVGKYTKVFMNYLREVIAERIPVEAEDIANPKKVENLKRTFYSKAKEVLEQNLGSLDKDKYDTLAGILLHQMYGLGDLEVLMGDKWLEEVAVNNANDPVAVYHRRYGWLKTNLFLSNEEKILTLANQISRKSGKEINLMKPIVDAHLPSGDRVASTLFPISSKGNTITIRKFARNPWTIIHFIDPNAGTISAEVAAFLWLGMQYELNLMVSGGTASGKTSMLNSICAFIPPQHRIITIEDTREISLPEYLNWNWVPLLTRGANPEGKGQIAMLDLMVASLRMRPDRIIVGEVRRRREAEALFEAMHTGHSVYSTIHADTSDQVLRRLIEPPIEIPETELEALHLIVTQYRDRALNKRKTLEVSEVVPTGSGGQGMKANYIYRWRARTNKFSMVSEPTRIIEILNLHTGMTVKEIEEDLDSKEKILLWMLDKEQKNIDQVGSILKMYYKDKDSVVKAAEKGSDPSKIMEG